MAGDDVMPSKEGDNLQGDQVRIRAKRPITTELGHIEKDKIGFVPKAWIQKAINNKGCSCNGSVNWFTWP